MQWECSMHITKCHGILPVRLWTASNNYSTSLVYIRHFILIALQSATAGLHSNSELWASAMYSRISIYRTRLFRGLAYIEQIIIIIIIIKPRLTRHMSVTKEDESFRCQRPGGWQWLSIAIVRLSSDISNTAISKLCRLHRIRQTVPVIHSRSGHIEVYMASCSLQAK